MRDLRDDSRHLHAVRGHRDRRRLGHGAAGVRLDRRRGRRATEAAPPGGTRDAVDLRVPLETLSISAYLLLGWTILPAIDRLIAAVSLLALVLLCAGGILYTVGVLFYRWDGLPYNRAIWHGFVLAGATCHYIALLDVITNN
jgi:hypothetical protein